MSLALYLPRVRSSDLLGGIPRTMHFFVRRIGVLPGYALIDQKGRNDIKRKFLRDVDANVSTIGAFVCCSEGHYPLKSFIRERLLGSDPHGAVSFF
jgi:hypothetical protein